MSEDNKSTKPSRLNPYANSFNVDTFSSLQPSRYENPACVSAPFGQVEKVKLSYSQVAESNRPALKFQPVSIKAPEPRAICTYHLRGICRNGDKCWFAHGTLCPKCNIHVLHPDQTSEEKQTHIDNCSATPPIENEDDIECCICMEKVRSSKCGRFGLLSCEHPFCLDCIRHWRSNSGMDSSVLRTCPICRCTSYYIIPSYSWITDKEEKEKISEDYKKNLKAIHCKHFNFGEGQCPFGSSCFYDHVYPDGTRQEYEIRKIKTSEDELRILNQVKLSDFFDAYNPQ
ncbi:putative E3 ubiquitin-protein ligase makorin-2 [Entomophthora muscae]|uniref:E3 ubiquitin-protein ligase makorin-2 n=1 Tax=Entomophthora muscae TaxID=34485 RepID=A0ACC2S2Y3_9FUNG|nr:putative E3 ubiquitin-protein ligase makorin-2 [Entomophthora muscae]